MGLNRFVERKMEDPLESSNLETPSSKSSSVVYTDVNIVPEHAEEGIESRISTLQEEIFTLQSKQLYLDKKRREALDKILDLKGSIRVFCRVRSPLSMNNWRLRSPLVFVESEKIIVGSAGTKKDFNVDRVFTQKSTQDDLFMEVEPILRSALDGNNVCLLAYGQTGTGKTYTMEGVNGKPGIVPRALEELFRHVSHDNSMPYTLSMSMLEVYVGGIRDLLAPKQPSFRTTGLVHRSNLSILTATNGAVEIEGLTDVEITDFKQANRWYSRGKRARSTSWTNVNETSSRSHCSTFVA